MYNLPVYTSALLRSSLSHEEGEVILGKDTRANTPPLWVHITPENEYNTYPLHAFKCIDDFRCFVRYGSAHGK